MAQAPKCKLCEQVHWPRFACERLGEHLNKAHAAQINNPPKTCDACTDKQTLIKALRAKIAALESVSLTAPRESNKAQNGSLTGDCESNSFDRKAYQREFMRAKRARDK